jgi:hypothetical protein
MERALQQAKRTIALKKLLYAAVRRLDSRLASFSRIKVSDKPALPRSRLVRLTEQPLSLVLFRERTMHAIGLVFALLFCAKSSWAEESTTNYQSPPKAEPVNFPNDPRFESRFATVNGTKYHYLFAEPKGKNVSTTVVLVRLFCVDNTSCESVKDTVFCPYLTLRINCVLSKLSCC